jgi:hypothetical protein
MDSMAGFATLSAFAVAFVRSHRKGSKTQSHFLHPGDPFFESFCHSSRVGNSRIDPPDRSNEANEILVTFRITV